MIDFDEEEGSEIGEGETFDVRRQWRSLHRREVEESSSSKERSCQHLGAGGVGVD